MKESKSTTIYFFLRLDMDEILEMVEEQWMVKSFDPLGEHIKSQIQDVNFDR